MSTKRKPKKPEDDYEGRSEWTEFDCPDCDANNPYTDGFSAGDTVVCMYCGAPFIVKKRGEGFKLIAD